MAILNGLGAAMWLASYTVLGDWGRAAVGALLLVASMFWLAKYRTYKDFPTAKVRR